MTSVVRGTASAAFSAALLLVIGTLELVPAYRGIAAPIVLVAAVVVPFALVWAGQTLRMPAVGVATVCALAALGISWWLLRTGSGGLSGALPHLLTTPRPAPATAAFLTPGALLAALVASAVAAFVFTPARRGRRTGTFAPLIGAALLYLGGQLLCGGHADRHGIAALAIVVVAAIGWSLPAADHDGTSPGGHARSAAGGWRPSIVAPVLAVVGVGAAVAAIAPASSAFEPRRHVRAPVVHLEQPNPLGLVGEWAQHPDTEILRARLTGTARLHLATLADFDGTRWQVDDEYHELGMLAPPSLPPGPQQPVSASVQILRLGGVWLPAPGRASDVSLPGTLVDADSGTLARVSRVHPGLRYTTRGSIDAASSRRLESASVPRDVPARYLALPALPSSFAQYAREAVRGASTPLEEAIAIEHAVATGRTRSPKAPTGSSYARLETFLFRPAGSLPGAQVGTSEQFAASFAVLARAVGLPTRVVVGFIAEPADASGVSAVRGRDALAWPEVYFAGAGWVPFAPTPGSTGEGGKQDLRQSVLTRLAGQTTAMPTPPPAPTGTPAPGTAPPSTAPSAVQAAPGGGTTTSALLLAGAAALLLAVIVLLGAARALRTARHRAGGAPGAWAEVLDVLSLLGHRPPRSRPAPEIAAGLDRLVASPGPLAHGVAVAAERAAFGPPGTSVAPAWHAVRALRRRARATLPWWRRALFALDPRPLLRRRA